MYHQTSHIGLGLVRWGGGGEIEDGGLGEGGTDRIRNVLIGTDPRIRTTRLRIPIWILLFSSVAFKILFKFFAYYATVLTKGTFTSTSKAGSHLEVTIL